MANNPFKFGEAVTGKYFTNRKKEIKYLNKNITAGQNMFMYSRRRLGKTSLIKTVLQGLMEKPAIVSIYVDLQRAATVGQFIDVYAKAIAVAFPTKEERIKKITNFFRSLIPSFEYTSEGALKASFDFSRTSQGMKKALEEVYEAPRKIAEKYNRKVIVVFDEFQEITKYNGQAFENKLRSFIQHHRDVAYVFMGSKTTLIREMFENPDRPFYQSAKIYPIERIDEKELVMFIKERFKSTGRKIADGPSLKITSISKNSPFHVQMLCSEIWLAGKEIVEKEDIDKAIDSIMHTQNELYYSWYNSISMHQRAVLGVLARETEIFSNDVRQKYSIGAASTVQASVKALVDKDYIEKKEQKYHISDPFFNIWLKRHTM